MKAIDNVYGQRAYNLLSRNTSARQGVMEPPSESAILARRKSAFDQRLGNVESVVSVGCACGKLRINEYSTRGRTKKAGILDSGLVDYEDLN